MPNALEKALPKDIRNNMRTLIAAALGLFLGLRYNDYVKKVIATIVPSTDNLLIEGLILIGITFGIVYLSIFIQRQLDGK